MKTISLILTSFFLLVFMSCSKQQEGPKSDELKSGAPVLKDSKKPADTKNNFNIPSERKIIKEGEISFESRDVKKTAASLKATANQLGGYVSKENENIFDDRIENKFTLRVPAANFEKLIELIASDAQHFQSKNIEVLDVTEEYVDMETRINTKKEVEKTYLGLLKQAKNMNDILAIQNQIGTLREDIESYEGRFRSMNDRIAYSTLTVTFWQETHSGPSFTGKFGNAFKAGWQNLIWFFVGLTYIWPFIIIIIGFIIFIVYIVRKSRKKNP